MKHEIAELLPFYANETLDAADRARVEAELAICASCTAELDELRALSGALLTRAADASDGSTAASRALDAALARINTTPVAAATTTLRTAWWGTPARYAAAAALVVGFSGAALAAWHAREVASNAQPAAVAGSARAGDATLVYRVTPGPNTAKVQVRAAAPLAAASNATTSQAKEAAPPQSVAQQHRLAKKARLELIVRNVEDALKAAQRTVRNAGGEVASLADSSPYTGGAVHDASLQVEVPADRLDDTLDHLGLLGTVQNRAIDAEDVDATIVDEEARLRNLRRAEADLRALMDKGGKVADILSVQRNLSDVRGQIEQLDAQHVHDLHRVATSTIAITFTEDRPTGTPAKPGPSARIDGAWHGGLNALADTAVALLSAIVWWVAYSPVPLAFAALAYGATRAISRLRAIAP